MLRVASTRVKGTRTATLAATPKAQVCKGQISGVGTVVQQTAFFGGRGGGGAEARDKKLSGQSVKKFREFFWMNG